MHNYELVFRMVGGQSLRTTIPDRPEGPEKFAEAFSVILNEGKWLNVGMGDHILMVNPDNILCVTIHDTEATDARS